MFCDLHKLELRLIRGIDDQTLSIVSSKFHFLDFLELRSRGRSEISPLGVVTHLTKMKKLGKFDISVQSTDYDCNDYEENTKNSEMEKRLLKYFPKSVESRISFTTCPEWV